MEKNKGFTLIELLISVAILSVVLLAVTSVMVTGSRSFTKGSADADMQREAQLVVNQMEDMIIDTNGGVNYIDNTDTRELVLFNASDDSGVTTYTEEVIKWTDADDTIVYSKWNVIYDVTASTYAREGAAIYENQLLAENVKDFSVDLGDISKDYAKDGTEIDIVQSVRISVSYIVNSGQVSYATSPVVTLRNRMMLSDSPTLIFENTPTESDTLKLYISSNDEIVGGASTRVPVQDMATTVQKGNIYLVYVMVNAENDVNTHVEWSIEETGTTSKIEDNRLFVGEDEPNSSLTIVATYKNNPTKKAKGVVRVEEAISNS